MDLPLAGAGAAGAGSELETTRTKLLADLANARVEDADLASLRGSPEFERLFADGPAR